LQKEGQGNAGYKIKDHEHALEEEQVTWSQQVTDEVDSLRSGWIERWNAAETAIVIDEVTQVQEQGISRPIDVRTIAVQRHPRIPEIAPGVVRQIRRDGQQHRTQYQRSHENDTELYPLPASCTRFHFQYNYACH